MVLLSFCDVRFGNVSVVVAIFGLDRGVLVSDISFAVSIICVLLFSFLRSFGGVILLLLSI